MESLKILTRGIKKLKAFIKWSLALSLHIANVIIPKKDLLVLNSIPDIESQTVSVLRWVAKNRVNQNIVLLVDGDIKTTKLTLERLLDCATVNISITRRLSLKGLWSYTRAKYILYTHILYGSRYGSPAGQTVVNMWHGVAIKCIWKCDKNVSKDGARAFVPSADYLLSTSETITDVLEVASGFPRHKILSTGLPRNDSFFIKNNMRERFRTECLGKYQKVVYYLPTFRKPRWDFRSGTDGVESESPLNMQQECIDKLSAVLKKHNAIMLVKPHNASAHYGTIRTGDDGLWLITDEWLYERGVTLYDSLSCSDMLITDISSIYIDYLVTKKPILFYFPDQHEYQQNRGFMLNPVEKWLPGKLVTEPSELVASLNTLLESGEISSANYRDLARVLNPQDSESAVQAMFTRLMEKKNK